MMSYNSYENSYESTDSYESDNSYKNDISYTNDNIFNEHYTIFMMEIDDGNEEVQESTYDSSKVFSNVQNKTGRQVKNNECLGCFVDSKGEGFHRNTDGKFNKFCKIYK